MSRTNRHALRELVVQWSHIAETVDRGYSLTFDDYLNDLDLRRLIAERLRELADARDGVLPQSLVVALADADIQFREATTTSDHNVWGLENERAEGWTVEREWWYYRLPKRVPQSW